MGVAIARRLGTGRHIALAEFDEASLARAADTLIGEGHRVTGVVTDISDGAAVSALARRPRTWAGFGAWSTPRVCHRCRQRPERIVHVDVIGTAQLIDVFLDHVKPGTCRLHREHGRHDDAAAA